MGNQVRVRARGAPPGGGRSPDAESLRTLTSITGWQTYAAAVLDAALHDVQGAAGSVMVRDPHRRVLRVVVARGPGRARVMGATVDVGAPIAGQVAETRKPLWVPDVDAHPQLADTTCRRKRAGRYRGKSLILVPWIVDDQVLGVLSLSSRAGQQFSRDDMTRVAAAAKPAATVVDQLMRADQPAAPPLWDTTNFQQVSLVHRPHVALDSVSAVLDLVHQAVVCFDPTGRITWINRAGRGLFPGHDDWIGTSVWKLPLQVPTADWTSFVEAGLANGKFPPLGDVNIPATAGAGPVLLQCRGSVFRRADNTVDGGCLVFSDRTATVRLNEQLVAAEQDSALGRLLAEVAHELANPLDSTRRLVQLARRKRDDAAAMDAHLDDALRAMNRMMGILKEVLVFARRDIHAGAGPLPLTQVLDRYFAELSAVERYPQVRIIRDYRGLGPIIPCTDFAAVIDNLVRNACDAMQGEGTLVVYGQTREDTYILEVQDTGPGIDAALLERIFEPFFTTKAYGEGTGLGLAMCRKMVESHGGTLTCTSEGGVGATFRLELPVQTPAHSETPA